MINRQVDGLIIASTQQNSKDIDMPLENNYPFVLVDRIYPEKETNYVLVDNFKGVQKATGTFIKFGYANREFYFRARIRSDEAAIAGYQETLKQFNIKPKKVLW